MKKHTIEIEKYLAEVQAKADKIVDKFVIAFFLMGLCFAPLYQTWTFSLGVGGLNVLLYLLAKFVPHRPISRHLISIVFSVFMLQFIGQSHGMAEFHFFFFTNIAILIIYQDWRIMIPYTVIAIAHHSFFFYFQLLGYDHLGEYFINYTEVNGKILFFHYTIAILMAVIAGWWAVIFRNQSIEMISIQEEIKGKNYELQRGEEKLKQNIEELHLTKENLTRQNNQLSLIFEGVPAMIYQLKMTPDGQMSIPLASKGAEVVLGLSPEDVMQNTQALIQSIHPEDLPLFQQSIMQSAQTLQNWRADLRLILNGKERWVRGSSKPTRLEDGSILWTGLAQEITELKKAELAVKESEEKLQSILSETQDVIWSVSFPDFKTLYVSPSVEKLYGISVDEWLKDVSWWERVIYPEDRGVIQEIFQSLEKTGKAEPEYRIITKGGDIKWITNKSKMILGKDGKPVRIDGVAADITLRKETEKQLRQLSTVAEKTWNGVVITNPKNEIIWINESFERLTGYTFAEVRGKNPKMLQGKDTDPAHVQQIREKLLQKKPFTQEILNYSKTGEAYWIELNITPILDGHGEIEQFIGIEKDVTHRKKADKEREELAKQIQIQNQELQNSLGQVLELRQKSEIARKNLEDQQIILQRTLNQNKAITDALDNSAIVSIANLQGKILKVNAIFCQISGYTEAELIGQDHRIVNSKHHEKEFWVQMWQTISRGKTWRAEVCNRTKNGALYWVDTVINPIYDETGKISQYLSIRSLITERKKAEEQLVEQHKNLANKTIKQNIINHVLQLSLAENENLDHFLQNVIDEVSKAPFLNQQPGVGIFIRKEKDIFELRVHKDISPKIQKLCANIRAGQCLCGTAALTKKIQFADCVDHRHTNTFEGIEAHGHYNIPILIQDEVVGVMVVYLEHGHPHKVGEVEFLETICFIIAETIERLRNQQTIKEQNQELQASLEKVMVLSQQSEEARKNAHSLLEKITQSINYAKRIQKAIIPREQELQKHFDSFVMLRPRDIVSGDFYWFAEKANRKILAVADCTGHGVSGAMMTMIGNNILNQIVHDYELHEPHEILNMMRPLLEKTLSYSKDKIRDGMDISILTIEKNAIAQRNEVSKISYAGAMTSLYYVENQEFKEIKADKVPIGGGTDEYFKYQKHELIFDFEFLMLNKNNPTSKIKNPTFYLCSDGFRDQFGGAENQKFMSKNFKKLLFEISDKPMAEQKQILEQTFDEWKGEHKQTDDVLVVGLRI